MDDWRWFVLGGMLALAIGVLRQIFLEIRSIRVMMNNDRKIPNEFTSLDD